ncbi:MAG TPA: flagellar hook-basal body protein [Candidatus Hydrogenedentes bacterium]|nr:flagellar hook-basal body protein [Candidatus Hydrogenedentota bacterium]
MPIAVSDRRWYCRVSEDLHRQVISIAPQLERRGDEGMIQGLYAAATGMMAVEARQSVIANNIANASTPGFRRQDGLQKGFYMILRDAERSPAALNARTAPGGGVRLLETFTDVSGGAVVNTGDPFHVALDGPGFIVVDTPYGERFTRNGKLSIDIEGHLATLSGHKVQNVGGGYIDVRGGLVEIDQEGVVKVDGLPTGQIRIVEFENPHVLSRQGHDLYAAAEAAAERATPAATTRVAPKSLETSNVQLPVEMIQMIMGLRAYAANQKVINAFEDTISRLIERVGSPL